MGVHGTMVSMEPWERILAPRTCFSSVSLSLGLVDDVLALFFDGGIGVLPAYFERGSPFGHYREYNYVNIFLSDTSHKDPSSATNPLKPQSGPQCRFE